MAPDTQGKERLLAHLKTRANDVMAECPFTRFTGVPSMKGLRRAAIARVCLCDERGPRGVSCVVGLSPLAAFTLPIGTC